MKHLGSQVISITRGRGPEMDRVNEAMEQLRVAIENLPGFPEYGNMAAMPEPPLEVTLIYETARCGNIGEMRHPGTTMLFRWWPAQRIPPESRPIIT